MIDFLRQLIGLKPRSNPSPSLVPNSVLHIHSWAGWNSELDKCLTCESVRQKPEGPESVGVVGNKPIHPKADLSHVKSVHVWPVKDGEKTGAMMYFSHACNCDCGGHKTLDRMPPGDWIRSEEIEAVLSEAELWHNQWIAAQAEIQALKAKIPEEPFDFLINEHKMREFQSQGRVLRNEVDDES